MIAEALLLSVLTCGQVPEPPQPPANPFELTQPEIELSVPEEPATETQPADESDPAAAPGGTVVITIDGQQLVGSATAIRDGQLVLDTDPPRQIPLDEIASIGQPGASVLEVEWIGQDNHDQVGTGGKKQPNEIQDLHLVLRGVDRDKALKQIVINCHHGEKLSSWRLDPSQGDSSDGSLLGALAGMFRAKSGALAVWRPDSSATAHLFIEPPRGDLHGRELAVYVTYEDDSKVVARVRASTHTDAKLAVAGKAAQPDKLAAGNEPGGEENPETPVNGPLVSIALERGDLLTGALVKLGEDQLELATDWGPRVEIPLVAVRGLRFGSADEQGLTAAYDKLLAEPAAEDTALVRGRNGGAPVDVRGTVRGLAEGQLKFEFQGEVRSINIDRVLAVGFAKRPAAAPRRQAYQVFVLAGGNQVSGSWAGVEGRRLLLDASWGKRIEVPSGKVARIDFRNGKLVYVSDLEPIQVEQVPYFDRMLPFRRDVNLQGEKLRLEFAEAAAPEDPDSDDEPEESKSTDTTVQEFRKGLAVHSRTLLAYDLDGQYQTFKSALGFDPSAGGRGHVIVRVRGDGRTLHEGELAGTDEPILLDLPVAGVSRLELEVDFGLREDICDRVIWGDARLYRARVE